MSRQSRTASNKPHFRDAHKEDDATDQLEEEYLRVKKARANMPRRISFGERSAERTLGKAMEAPFQDSRNNVAGTASSSSDAPTPRHKGPHLPAKLVTSKRASIPVRKCDSDLDLARTGTEQLVHDAGFAHKTGKPAHKGKEENPNFDSIKTYVQALIENRSLPADKRLREAHFGESYFRINAVSLRNSIYDPQIDAKYDRDPTPQKGERYVHLHHILCSDVLRIT